MITCLLIANKFNEKDEDLIKIADLRKEAKNDYTYKKIVSWEAKILQELKWNMMLQTSIHYMQYFNSAGIIFSSDEFEEKDGRKIKLDCKISENLESIEEWVRNLNNNWEYFINLSVHDYYMLQFGEEIIAMAWVVWARKITNIFPEYSKIFEYHYSISFKQIQSAFERMWTFHMQICAAPNSIEENSSSKLNNLINIYQK